jgi:hypothetical protein
MFGKEARPPTGGESRRKMGPLADPDRLSFPRSPVGMPSWPLRGPPPDRPTRSVEDRIPTGDRGNEGKISRDRREAFGKLVHWAPARVRHRAFRS